MTTTTTMRPTAPLVIPANVPAELRERPQWVCWRPEQTKDGRWTKPPINARTGGKASPTNPRTWMPFASAITRLPHDPGLAGVGFMFSADDPYAGVDLDNCYDASTGTLAAWAQRIVSMLDTYTEISPSGRGVKCFMRATHPGGGKKTSTVEMYDEKRFFTVTGRRLPGTPATINDRHAAYLAVHRQTFGEPTPAPPAPSVIAGQIAGRLDDQAVIELCRRSKDGAKFERLMAGVITDYPHKKRPGEYDESAADQGLANLIAFFTGPDLAQVVRILRMSGLWDEKWERADYQRWTIEEKAFGRQRWYTPPAQASSNGNHAEPVSAVAVDNINGTPGTPDTCADVRAELAKVRAELAAALAENDQLRAENADLRRVEQQRAQLMRNPRMADGPKLMLMALAPEIASVRSGAGAPTDPDRHDPRTSGDGIHVDLGALADRQGCSSDAAGDRVAQLVAGGLFVKRHRPKQLRDPVTGVVRYRGRELLLVPTADVIDELFAAGANAATPGQANRGGLRQRICLDHPDAPIAVIQDTTYVCTDCGVIVDKTTKNRVQTANRQDAPSESTPSVDVTVLRTGKMPLREHRTPRETCRECGRPLLSMLERQMGRCARYCLRADDTRPPANDIPQPAWIGGDR